MHEPALGLLGLVYLEGLGLWAFAMGPNGPSEASLVQYCLPLRQKNNLHRSTLS